MTQVTVGQFLAFLENKDKNLPVYIQGYEGGLEDLDLSNIVESQVIRDFNSEEHEHYGRHEDVNCVGDKTYTDEYGLEVPFPDSLGLVICRRT